MKDGEEKIKADYEELLENMQAGHLLYRASHHVDMFAGSLQGPGGLERLQPRYAFCQHGK